MKDASPRIFRNLEKTGGLGGFDTIVGAAVASFGSLRLPSEHQARDFGRLVVPLWDKITPETRRSLAATLSSSPRMPREIVERLMAEPVEISAPFLLSSPTLSEADLMTLRRSRDRRLRKLIDSRMGSVPEAGVAGAAKARPSSTAELVRPTPNGAADPVAAPGRVASRPSEAALGSAARSRAPAHAVSAAAAAAPPFAATPATPPPAVPPADAIAADEASGSPASRIRQALRRLALPGRRQPRLSTGVSSVGELVAIAVRQDAERFYAGLGHMLGLSGAVCRRIEADEDGERLAVALKALNLGAADALTVLMMLKPRIGLDVAAFERMTKFYRALTAEDCAALARGNAGAAPPPPQFRPQYQDVASLLRPAPRPEFGRRKTRPGEGGKESRTG